MAFTYTDSAKVILEAWGRFQVTLLEAVVPGDLLSWYNTDNAYTAQFADQGDSQRADCIAMEAGEAGDTIWACLKAVLKTISTIGTGGVVTQVYFAGSSDFFGAPLYLGESGKPSSTEGTTYSQEVGHLLARDRILLDVGLTTVGHADFNHINVTRESSDSGNAIYADFESSATSGGIYSYRGTAKGTTTDASTTSIRGARITAEMGAGAKSALLEGGLFTAKVSAGSCTVTNIRALSGHVSIGATLVVSGECCCVNAHMQTRGSESIGVHCGVLIKNEAVGGNGLCLAQGAIYITESSLGGSVKGYECLIDASTCTMTVHDTDRTTLIKFKDSGGTVRKLVFDPTNNTVVAVQT